MMYAIATISELSHEEIRAWLFRALQGQELLPRLTPDEFNYLGILRLEKQLKPAARDSLREGCRHLIRQFCADGQGQPDYLLELLSLSEIFKDPEAVEELSRLALRFPQLTDPPIKVRLAVLAALVDAPPPRSLAFWLKILEQDPNAYAPLALSGVLATNPAQAVSMLSAFPNTTRAGQSTALKLELAWDTFLPVQRFQFIQNIQTIIPKCGVDFAAPVAALHVCAFSR